MLAVAALQSFVVEVVTDEENALPPVLGRTEKGAQSSHRVSRLRGRISLLGG